MLPPSPTSIEQVCRLDVAIGQFFGEVARALADQHGKVDAVCSHGQTVYHWVEGDEAKGTLQLGEPAWIAERTGVAVVSDVRNRDIAAGGHGAPLASLLDVLLLGSRSEVVRGSLNLGGIANVTVVGPDREPIAFDIGPSNALMDAAVDMADGWPRALRPRRCPGRPRARSTRRSSQGCSTTRTSRSPPEVDGQGVLQPRLRDEPPARARAFPRGPARLVDGGIGRDRSPRRCASSRSPRSSWPAAAPATPPSWASCKRRLPGVSLRSIEEFGIPEAAKEALVFAVIGFLTLNGLPATVPSCTGARGASVLGSDHPGGGPPCRCGPCRRPPYPCDSSSARPSRSR